MDLAACFLRVPLPNCQPRDFAPPKRAKPVGLNGPHKRDAMSDLRHPKVKVSISILARGKRSNGNAGLQKIVKHLRNYGSRVASGTAVAIEG